MELAYTIIGYLFCVTILVSLSATAVFFIVNKMLELKDTRCEDYICGQIASYQRWLGYDFPEVDFALEVMEKDLKNCWARTDLSTLRDKMRDKFKDTPDEN